MNTPVQEDKDCLCTKDACLDNIVLGIVLICTVYVLVLMYVCACVYVLFLLYKHALLHCQL